MKISFLKTVPYYSASNIVVSGLLFALVPFMTRFLSLGDLGKVYIFQATVTLMFAIVGVGSQSILQSYFFNHRNEFVSYLFSALGNSIVVVLMLLLLIMLIGDDLFGIVNLDYQYAYYALFLASLFYMKSLAQMIFQARGEAKHFLTSIATSAASGWLVTVCALVYFSQDWRGRIYGMNVELLVMSCVFAYIILQLGFKRPNTSKMRELLIAGSPVIIHSISMLLINQTDKFMLSALIDEDTVGIYGVNAQFASSVALFGGTLAMAYNPILYQRLASSEPGDVSHIAKIRRTCILLIILFAICVTAIVGLFPRLLFGEEFEFHLGSYVVLTTANMMFAIYYLYSGYFYYFRNTRYLAMLTSFIAVTNILVSLFAIPRFGLYGASAGTLVAFMFGLSCSYGHFLVVSKSKIDL